MKKKSLPSRPSGNIQARVKNIRLLVLDVDGVMTDGSIILDNRGNEHKAFHVRDGHGIKMFIRAGRQVAIITGRKSKVVDRRAAELGITEVFQKCYDKKAAVLSLMIKFGLTSNEIAYIGDDIVDVPLMEMVGLPIAVADAADEAKRAARVVTRNRGGRGAVREITDFILKAQGLWEDLFHEYSKI